MKHECFPPRMDVPAVLLPGVRGTPPTVPRKAAGAPSTQRQLGTPIFPDPNMLLSTHETLADQTPDRCLTRNTAGEETEAAGGRRARPRRSGEKQNCPPRVSAPPRHWLCRHQRSEHLQWRGPSRRGAAEEWRVCQCSGPTDKNFLKQSSPHRVPGSFC